MVIYEDAAAAARAGHVFPEPEADPAEREYLLRFGDREMRGAWLIAGSLALISAAAAILAGSPFPLLLLVPAAAMSILVPLCLRNPRRRIAATPGAILAPADGRVIEPDRPDGPAAGKAEGEGSVTVSIRTSLLDVCVNRMPCAGTVSTVSYRVDPENPERIEDVTIGLVPDPPIPGCDALVVRQLARGPLRRISCRVRSGDRVRPGTLFGSIAFGSITELHIPARAAPLLEFAAAPGRRVLAGVTVIGTRRDAHGR